MKRLLVLLTLAFATINLGGCGGEDVDYSELTNESYTSLVNDFADVLSDDEEQQLEAKCVSWRESTTNELAIVIVDDLSGKTIEEYAVDLGRNWKVGSPDKDNGIIFLVSISDKEYRVEVGDDLQGDLPDGKMALLLDHVFKSNFKEGDYYEGLNEGADRVIAVVGGEKTIEELAKEDQINWVAVVIVIVIIIVVLMIICAIPGGSDVLLAVGAGLASGGGSSGGGSFGGGGCFSGGGFSGGW